MLHSNDHKPTNYFEKNVMQYLTLSKLGAHARTHKCTATQCADLKQANILEKKKKSCTNDTHAQTHAHTACRPSCLSQQIFGKKSHAPKTQAHNISIFMCFF